MKAGNTLHLSSAVSTGNWRRTHRRAIDETLPCLTSAVLLNTSFWESFRIDFILDFQEMKDKFVKVPFLSYLFASH